MENVKDLFKKKRPDLSESSLTTYDSLLRNLHNNIFGSKIIEMNNVEETKQCSYDSSHINKNGKITAKQKDDFLLFSARNKNESEILKHFSYTLTKKYS